MYLSWVQVLELLALSVLVLLYVRQARNARERRLRKQRTVAQLAQRADADLRNEFATIQRRTKAGIEVVERWWAEVARFYGVDPKKLRAADRIQVELKDLCYDVDNPIAFAPFVVRRPRLFGRVLGRALAQVQTWADLIAVLILAEQAAQTESRPVSSEQVPG